MISIYTIYIYICTSAARDIHCWCLKPTGSVIKGTLYKHHGDSKSPVTLLYVQHCGQANMKKQWPSNDVALGISSSVTGSLGRVYINIYCALIPNNDILNRSIKPDQNATILQTTVLCNFMYITITVFWLKVLKCVIAYPITSEPGLALLSDDEPVLFTDTLTRTYVRVSKMNAVVCAQLTFQVLGFYHIALGGFL